MIGNRFELQNIYSSVRFRSPPPSNTTNFSGTARLNKGLVIIRICLYSGSNNQIRPLDARAVQMRRCAFMNLRTPILILVVLNALDSFLTLAWIKTGIASETNLLMASLLGTGVLPFLLFK